MHPLKTLTLLAAAALTLCAVTSLQAASQTESISSEDFVEEASAKGVAEIETAKLALEKSQNEAVKGFAQMMIDDHRRANQQLAELAKSKDLEVSDDAELINQAKALVPAAQRRQLRQGLHEQSGGRSPRDHRVVPSRRECR